MSTSNKPSSKTAPVAEIVGSHTMHVGRGVVVSIERGKVRDYAGMRAMQLSALLKVTVGETGESFRGFSEVIQDNLMWLASTMADEMVDLLELVDLDANTGGAA